MITVDCPYLRCTESVIFFFASSLKDSMVSIEMPLNIFQHTVRMLFALPAAQVLLKMASFMVAKISTYQTYQLFFPYISWDKCHHIPVLLMVILSTKRSS